MSSLEGLLNGAPTLEWYRAAGAGANGAPPAARPNAGKSTQEAKATFPTSSARTASASNCPRARPPRPDRGGILSGSLSPQVQLCKGVLSELWYIWHTLAREGGIYEYCILSILYNNSTCIRGGIKTLKYSK